MTRRLVLVGNAPVEGDRAALVDGADAVVRFNGASGFAGATGSRTDRLFLVNCGGQMREWLDDPAFAMRPAVAAARRIVLPIAPTGQGIVEPDADRFAGHVNHAAEATARLRAAGRAVRVLPRRAFEAACAALAIEPDGGRAPSTGFVALHHYRTGLPAAWTVELVGFGFDGWQGHAWDAERTWVERRLGRGLVWHDASR